MIRYKIKFFFFFFFFTCKFLKHYINELMNYKIINIAFLLFGKWHAIKI